MALCIYPFLHLLICRYVFGTQDIAYSELCSIVTLLASIEKRYPKIVGSLIFKELSVKVRLGSLSSLGTREEKRQYKANDVAE